MYRAMKRHFHVFVLMAAIAVGCTAQSNPAQYEYAGRDARQQPERIMEIIGVRPGMIIGEAGAGGGYFTVKLAEEVGPEGKIYANDIRKNYLEYIDERAKKEGFTNIETILGEERDPLFPDGSLDMVFMLNVYHHLDYKEDFLRNIVKDLKPGGTLVIVESDKDRRPSNGHSTDPDDVLTATWAAGYEVVLLDREHPKDFILIVRPVEQKPH